MPSLTTNVLTVLLLFALLGTHCHSSKKTGTTTFSRSQAKLLNSNTFPLTAIADDSTYGYTKENPIQVGGAKNIEGPMNERRFLNALTGPNGETIQYRRRGSCCPFKTPNGLMGTGLLDIYEIVYEEAHNEKPIVLYINMYDFGKLEAPKGFTFKQ